MSNLRPMQLGEILDGTFSIYRRHFALFLKLSMIIMWLPTAVWVYVQVRYTGTNAMALAVTLQDHPLSFVLSVLGLAVFWMVAGLMLKAASIRVISDSYLGQEPQLGSALSLSAAKLVPLVLVGFAKTLLLIIVYI